MLKRFVLPISITNSRVLNFVKFSMAFTNHGNIMTWCYLFELEILLNGQKFET